MQANIQLVFLWVYFTFQDQNILNELILLFESRTTHI
jgi:hypothetical protein